MRSVPAGRVSSYGRIAADAGLPGRARLVGKVLRETDEDVPWHRILRADGRIAFPEGSAGYEKQQRRLVDEGVKVRRGRVAMREFAGQPDLDELLWRR